MIGGGGPPQQTMLLNKTLVYIVSLLTKYQLTEWFIGYGTLLGIVRNNSCINGDDDIDIIINRKYKSILHQIAEENNFKITLQKPYFLRFDHPDYAPIDFYLAKVHHNEFMDTWENAKWTNVYPFIKKKWKGVTLQIPNQHIKKLRNRYGPTWRTPRKYKGKHAKTVKKPLTFI
jgi:phosphorylcholine metabolism protein LicD